MTEQKMIQAAFSEGFQNAAIIETDALVFDPSFRPYCEQNRCGRYGVNYSCPPDCGTPDEMKKKVLSYRKALVVQTEWEISDLNDKEKLRDVRNKHNAAMLQLIAKLRREGQEGIIIGAGGCTLCERCAILESEPCRHPAWQHSCISAYCIHAQKMAESSKINFDYVNGILPFFGMYIFAPK